MNSIKRGNGKIALMASAVLPLLLFIVYFFIIYNMMAPGRAISSKVFINMQVISTIILILTMLTIGFACYIWVKRSLLSELAKNTIFSATVFLILLLAIECFFLHYERTNGIGARWSYKLWDKKFLTHRTSFYFIDSKGENRRADFREPIPDLKKKEKKSIWFIGDSFTFGFGLQNTSQTFPAIIQQQLSQRFTCVNLGDGGADTYDEKETLFAFDSVAEQGPKAVVWQYFGNDIDSAGGLMDSAEHQIPKTFKNQLGTCFFHAKSFLLDYIYWEYFRQNEKVIYDTYTDFLSRAYTTDSIVVDGEALIDSRGNYINPFRSHLQPLKQCAEYYKSKGTKFLVIIFPYLWKDGPENAEKLYTRRLSAELSKEGIDVVDLTPLVKDIPAEKRVANSHDPHPSPMVAKIVADTISKYITMNYLTQPFN